MLALLIPPKAQVRCVPSTPAPARKRRRPNQDLQDRLTRCEDLLKKYGAEKPPDGNSPRPSINSDELRWQPAGKLVREDGNVRFVDNPLLQVVYDEVRGPSYPPAAVPVLTESDR